MNAPPKQVADQLRELTEHAPPYEAPAELTPVRRDAHAVAPSVESLPVLEAFRTFLEAERRQTRQRMRAMIVAFAVVLVAVVAGGLTIIRSHLAAISRDYGVIREALEDDAARFDRNTAEAVARVGRTAQATQDAAARAEAAAVNLRADLDRQSEALLGARGALGVQLGVQSNTLDRIHAFLEVLRAENRSVRDRLQALQTDLPSLAGEVEAVRGAMAELRALPRQIAPAAPPVGTAAPATPTPTEVFVAAVDAPKPARTAPAPPTERLALMLVPQGGKRPARWQFLVPAGAGLGASTARRPE